MKAMIRFCDCQAMAVAQKIDPEWSSTQFVCDGCGKAITTLVGEADTVKHLPGRITAIGLGVAERWVGRKEEAGDGS